MAEKVAREKQELQIVPVVENRTVAICNIPEAALVAASSAAYAKLFFAIVVAANALPEPDVQDTSL